MPYAAKVCLLGDFSVGKTSLIRQFVESRFDDAYLSTIGVRVSRKVMMLPETMMTFLVWDTAGSEPFNDLVRAYYRGSSGALLVCDLTRPSTVASLALYARDFRDVNPDAPLVVMANKVDLTNMRAVSDNHLIQTSEMLAAPWFLTSAKTGEAVEESFRMLARRIYSERNSA